MVKNIAVDTTSYHVKTIKLLALLALKNFSILTIETQTNNEKEKFEVEKKLKKKLQNARKAKNTNIILEKHKIHYIKPII